MTNDNSQIKANNLLNQKWNNTKTTTTKNLILTAVTTENTLENVSKNCFETVSKTEIVSIFDKGKK